MVDLFFAELTYRPESAFGAFFTAIGESPALLPVVYTLVALPLLLWKRKKLSRDARIKIISFMIYACSAVLFTALIVWLLKQCWGRMRYVDLGENAAGFSPWYMPKGPNGHESFPSGHAAMSALIFLIPDGIRYFLGKSYKIVYVLSFAFVAAVVVARMLLGAHYLSDLIAGVLIAYAVRKALSSLLTRSRTEPRSAAATAPPTTA